MQSSQQEYHSLREEMDKLVISHAQKDREWQLKLSALEAAQSR